MKKFMFALAAIALILSALIGVQAQTAGSISGSVMDPNGAMVPGATVKVKGDAGQEFTATTADNGTFKIPAVQNGLYVVTITANGFKTTTITNVKVNVNAPTPVDAKLELGNVGETVEISSGGEVLQTETATIGTTITGRQILETPIASRDALDLIGLLPGTATVGRPRQASINGLPKGSLNITLDGVDVQDNLLRSSDGYFTYVRPRVDAIEEVTVSTAVPGAEASGDGAVQLSFRTKRGGNGYHGGVFFQHRDESLNANYWYLNRDGARDTEGHAFRQKIRLNQFGGHASGPIPFFAFGDGGGPHFKSGRDTAFFFVNYEQYRLPNSQARTRVILSPSAQAGTYSYVSGGITKTADLYAIALANGQLATPDSTVGSLLTQIRAAVGTTGSVTPISGSPNLQNFLFSPVGNDQRKFLTTRFDVNITKNHSVEFIINRDDFVPSKDFLNSQDERFPGMPFYTQGSKRDAYSLGVRSTLSKSWINYGRYTISTGQSFFSQGISKADYGYQGGYDLLISAAGATTATARNSYSDRNSPTYAFDDSLTWLAGSHSITFGGQYKRIKLIQNAIGRIVPSITFGLDSTSGSADQTAFNMFNGTSLPGSTSAQQTEAKNLYAVLVGRLLGYTTTAYLTGDGTYKENALQSQNARQDTYGLFAQDSWKIRSNVTVNFGLRWQPQGAYTILTDNYARLSSFADVYGLSGLGNLFKPGTLTGAVPTVVGMKAGEKAYSDDKKNFAPTVGVVWSPEFSGGFLKSVFGGPGKSVFRGGFSVSFVREGTALIGSLLGANPGGSLVASRNLSLGNFLAGTNLRDANNPNLTAGSFPTSPAYPFAVPTGSSSNAFDPSLKTGSVNSFSFGYQREIDSNTVVEVRYVGNRGHDLFRQHNINELNTIENGFAAEYRLAQANLYANEAAFAAGQVSRRACPAFVVVATQVCQTSSTNTTLVQRVPTFSYFGAGTSTSPLPIMIAYFNAAASNAPSNPAVYNSTLFFNSTLVTQLSQVAPSLIAFAGNVENSAARRANALANGLASNFFYVNPTSNVGGAFVLDNSADSSYDSGVVELRRRLSQGLRVQASYVWSKAMSNSFQSNSDNFANFSHRPEGLKLAQNVAVFDIRHQFKFDATYDLPFGRGRKLMSNANGFVDALLGGWTLSPTLRWQSGTPFSFGNVALVGMSTKELQKAIGVYKNTIVTTGGVSQQVVTYLPLDILDNTRRAFDINVANANGYGTTFGGAPTGRYIAPAGNGNCVSRFSGECGFNNLIVYGPGYFKLDSSLSKQFKITETSNIQIRATFLDVLNMPNFRVGGWTADTVAITPGGSTFGQLGNGSAYQDISTTNDPGGRLIDLMIRFNF